MTYRKRPRGIARRRPAPTPVQPEALVLDDPEHTTAAEGLGVGLALDLEHVKRQENDLADTDQAVPATRQLLASHTPSHPSSQENSPAGGRVHDGLARLLAKRRLKVLAVVRVEVVARDGLAAVLVHTLQHLVAGGVPETGEQRDELPPERRAGLVLEDDRVELRQAGDLCPGVLAGPVATDVAPW